MTVVIKHFPLFIVILITMILLIMMLATFVMKYIASHRERRRTLTTHEIRAQFKKMAKKRKKVHISVVEDKYD